MDWQAKFSQLVGIIDPTRSFPPDFAWDDEATIDALIKELRAHAKTDHQVENAALKASLAAVDAKAEAKQRLKALGATDADLEKLGK